MAATVFAAIVLGSSCQIAAALNLTSATGSGLSSRASSALSSATATFLGAVHDVYTTNALCSKSNCINPIFPGMEDLHRLQQSKWISSSLKKTSEHLRFCQNAINYDPALPPPMGGGSASIKKLVQYQDNAAATMFHYHVTGLGLEAWDYRKPEFSNDCIKSIWRMTCYTYFPRAQIGVQDGAFSNYVRPCQSSCQNYVKSCGVECCDESVQCVFSHSKSISKTQKVTTEGYIPHDGPSSLCTGGARRAASPLGVGFWAFVVLQALFSLDGPSVAAGMRSVLGRRLLWTGTLVIVALLVQGCDYDVPVHNVGNWRAEPDYLLTHEFIPPGASAKDANLNSCALPHLSQTLQCSGRGVCKLWDPNNLNNMLAFCECDRDWADPECRTKRKSQLVAYMLSLFTGFLGLDQFYLGFVGLGLLKLFTFGGFGVLWVSDIISIGSAPVYSSDYRCARDLPHFAFVLTATMYAVLIGFTFAYFVTIKYRARKRSEAMTLQLDEEARQGEATMKKPFAAAYGPGMKRPVIQQEKFNPDAGQMQGGYGAMGMGGMPPSMGMGGMGPGMGGPMGGMPQSMSMGGMGPGMGGPMGPVPSTMMM